jgi:hypothetical protein
LHRFDYRQAKTFEVGWINETKSAAIKSGKVSLGDVTRKYKVIAERVTLSRPKRFAIKPTTFSSQDKLGKLNLWTNSAQA